MSYVNIDALAVEYVKAGINVDIFPGAHTRAARMYVGSGYVRGPQGLDRHHTAQSTSMSEMASIQYMTLWAKYPVMTNTYPWKNGDLTICAAGPTYTAGSGGPLGDVTSGNAEFWSMEIGNNGVGEPYSAAQQETILRATAVEVEFFGSRYGWDQEFTKNRIPAHFEWAPGRKIDPYGPSRWNDNQNTFWDMDRFRADVKSMHADLYLTGGEEMTPPTNTTFSGVEPYRAADTRNWPKAPLAGGEVARFGLGDGIPSDTKYALVTVTAVNPERGGYISMGLPGTQINKTSSLNYAAGAVIGNTTVVALRNRQFDIVTSATSHVIVDVIGYYS